MTSTPPAATRTSSNSRRVTCRSLPDGSSVAAAHLPLPPGWNRPATTVEFIVPIAFPSAQPDCFFAEADLRLANGQMPTNAGMGQLEGQARLWFSWHLVSWSPGRDDIETYLRFIERRLRDVR